MLLMWRRLPASGSRRWSGRTPVVVRDLARLVADAGDVAAYGAGRHQRLEPLGPFDHRDAAAVDQLLEAEVEQLGEGGRAVRVHVVHRQAAAVLVDEHEGRAGGAARHPERAHEPLHEDRLAGAELPGERAAGPRP